MAGSEIVQIISLFLTAIVSIVTLLVRARIIALEGEIKDLHETLTAANVLILKQGNTIDTLSTHLMGVTPVKTGIVKQNPYEGFPPYRKPDKQP